MRKDFIIFYIVFTTNVFSCGGVNSWNFFIFKSLCESRLVDHKAMFLVGGGWMGNRNGLKIRGSEAAARSYFEDFVFNFFFDGASSEPFLCLRFLASALAALVFFSFEAAEGTLRFEPVMLVGKTI